MAEAQKLESATLYLLLLLSCRSLHGQPIRYVSSGRNVQRIYICSDSVCPSQNPASQLNPLLLVTSRPCSGTPMQNQLRLAPVYLPQPPATFLWLGLYVQLPPAHCLSLSFILSLFLYHLHCRAIDPRQYLHYYTNIPV